MGTEMKTLVDLPEIVLEKIFSFLTFDNISLNRTVCTKFNEIGCKALNKGYFAAERFHGKTLKSIKAKLPRRESERRAHPLARQCDILIAIETRLSMLSMTYTKWIDAKLCCFIPGKVIDEIMRVLRCVAHNPNQPRTHEILQELRDISSMAMEHFDEKILPQLKGNRYLPIYLQGSRFRDPADQFGVLPKPKNNMFPATQKVITVVDFNKLVMRESMNRRKIKAQALEISELRKHVEEWEAKLRDLSANLTKATELPSTSSIMPSGSAKRKKDDAELRSKQVKSSPRKRSKIT
ncbi:F-box only protein 28 [Cimex lectularius]|uniref:F-box domain-containing protein n=1 Tax=Cimex lectularius TaxID=79782 RepID=A0A8I6TJ02_CIMLE|nr:F-box only protein 28 [Cimex lectularius]